MRGEGKGEDKAFFGSVLRAQKRKTTHRTNSSGPADYVPGHFILFAYGGPDRSGVSNFLPRSTHAHVIQTGFTQSHKASGLVLGEGYFRSFV